MAGPPVKPKYILIIDSEQVPWGKGEKNPLEGSEKNLKFNADNLLEQYYIIVTTYLLYNGSAS